MGRGPLDPGRNPARTFRLLVEYDGTAFLGWQVQPGMRTIQGELEQVLARVLGTPVRITGAGRTDRGVHALGQVASFTAATTRLPAEILGGLNAWLPADVRVRDVSEVGPGFHARHSALRRRYRYLMRMEPTALDRERCWVLPHAVNARRMRDAARTLLGEHDFSGFTIAAPETENTRVVVFEAGLRRRGSVLQFDIEGNRFVRKMVRAVVGALVEVGRGRLESDFFTRTFCADEVVGTFAVAPACGLYLVSVTYDDGPSRP